jgi:hypothetical protein
MSSSRRRDFSILCEEFGEEFYKKTNDRGFLDLEEDGLDGIFSQLLDLFEERRCSLEKIVQGIRSDKGEMAKSSVAIEKPAGGMGSVVLNISGDNCNVAIVKKS